MRRLALLLALAVALSGCGAKHSAAPARGRGTVTALTDIGQLRAAFDAHRDVPRLIVLASPT